MKQLLFPDPPRDFAHRRTVKIAARAIHGACAGVYAGALVFGVDADLRLPWAIAAVTTGLFLLAVDLHETCAILLQVRGLVVLFKIAVLIALPWLGPVTVAAILVLMVVASVSSHAPSRWRYRMWAGQGRVKASHSKG